jgi:hypothetical protein
MFERGIDKRKGLSAIGSYRRYGLSVTVRLVHQEEGEGRANECSARHIRGSKILTTEYIYPDTIINTVYHERTFSYILNTRPATSEAQEIRIAVLRHLD